MQPRQTTLFATPAHSLTATSYLPTVLLAPSSTPLVAPIYRTLLLNAPDRPNSCRNLLYGTGRGVSDNDADALNAAITTGMIMNFIVLRGRLFADFYYSF